MIYYYQYDENGWITARVASDTAPVTARQFSSNVKMEPAYKRYDPNLQEVATYKPVYGEDGETIIDKVVDTNVAKIQVGG